MAIDQANFLAEQDRLRKEQEKRTALAKAEIEGRKAPQINAPRLGAAPQIAQVNAPQAATLGDAGQDIRGRALQGLDLLQQTATGQTPSVAQMRFQQNLERGLAAQQAAANTAGTSLAARQAQIQGSQTMQAGAAEAAALAQQEQMSAQQAFLQAAGQMRGQDIQRAEIEGGFQQRAGELGAQFEQQRALSQAEIAQRQQITGAELGLQANTAQAQLLAQRQSALDQFTQNALNQGMTYDQARSQAQLQMMQMEEQRSLAERQLTEQRKASQRDTWAKIGGGILGGAATIGAAVLSDENSKENISPGGGSVQDFLNALSPKDFNYKGESEKKTGVIAQDLEKSDLGKDILTEVGGMKAIKPDMGLFLASLAQINERLKNLEGGV